MTTYTSLLLKYEIRLYLLDHINVYNLPNPSILSMNLGFT
jgi:hypothetical protein